MPLMALDSGRCCCYNLAMISQRIPKKTDERWVWIKGQLELRGESFASMARELGVSRQAVRSVREAPYPKMEKAIAKKLGMQAKNLWPERYIT